MQALPQQIPCSQKPDWHSAAAPQVAPADFLPQLPPLQVLGALQSALVEHVVRQAPFAPQTYGSQLDGVAAMQLPVPLHDCAGVKVTPVHVDGAQVVPAM